MILVQPIPGKGFFGTLSEIHNFFVNYNPRYSERINVPHCVANADSCKETSTIRELHDLIVSPSLIFVMRHFLSFFIVFFLLFTMLKLYQSVESFNLKINAIGLLGTLIFLIVLLCRWVKQMTINFPVSEDLTESKPINMRYIPLIGGINIIIAFFLFFARKLLFSIEIFKTVSIFTVIGLLMLQITCALYLKPNLNMDSLVQGMYYLLFFIFLGFFASYFASFFGFEYILNNTLISALIGIAVVFVLIGVLSSG